MTSKTQHTPGEWRIFGNIVFAGGDNGANICAVSSPRKSKMVGYVELDASDPDFAEATSNARLIAAAPELLRAAELFVALLDTVDADSYPSADIAQLKAQTEAIIAKAKGEQT